MLGHVKNLYHHRELLLVWTMREIRVRYSQSLLGGAWAILQPLSLMLVFTVIFSYFVQVPTDGVPYPLFSYSALLPWTFFATSISFGVPALTQNMNLVTKIYFPREILAVSAVAAAFVDFLVASSIFAALMVFYGTPPSVSLLAVPLMLAIQVLLTLGIVLFASALNVFYRDIRFVVPLALQIWMYATPVIYPVTLVPERFQQFYRLNPMVALIEGYRAAAIQGSPPDWAALSVSGALSFGAFLLGYRYFKSVEGRFADLI